MEAVFAPPPDGESYEMLNPDETAEFCVFAYLGQFLSFIQPNDIPVGKSNSELKKKTEKSQQNCRISPRRVMGPSIDCQPHISSKSEIASAIFFHCQFHSFFQSLRVEAGFVACVTIGILLSLVVPAFAVASSCSTLCVPRKDVSSTVEGSQKFLVFVLLLVVLIVG